MKTARKLSAKQLDTLEQRMEFKLHHCEISYANFQNIMLALAKERLRRAGVDSRGLMLQDVDWS